MILKVSKKEVIRTLKEFADKFDSKKWIDDNIHLYEDFMEDEYELLEKLLQSFFSEYKHIVSILDIWEERMFIISEYEIPYAVCTKNKVFPCNSRLKAEKLYMDLAKIQLSGKPQYKQYDKSKIDYTVMERFVQQFNINLTIIGK